MEDSIKAARWFPKAGAELVEKEELNSYEILLFKSGKALIPAVIHKETGTFAEESTQFINELIENKIKGFKTDLINDCGKITKVVPLTSGSTNAIYIMQTSKCGSVILKSYKRLRKFNNEVNMLKYLNSIRFGNVPKLYAVIKYRGLTAYVIMEYLNIRRDSGEPVYKSAIEFLTSPGSSLDYVKKHLMKLGGLVGEFHNVMSRCEGWCKPRTFDLDDLACIANSLHELVMDSGLCCDLLEYAVVRANEVKETLKDAIGMIKIKTHSDLHFQQIVKADNDYYFIDLEGEPLRTYDSPYLELALKDVATMIRAIHYIAFTAYSHFTGLDNFAVVRSIDSEEWNAMKVWVAETTNAFLKGYLSTVDLTKVIGVSNSRKLLNVLKGLIMEKALYELVYEQYYRPDNVPIPLSYIIYPDRYPMSPEVD